MLFVEGALAALGALAAPRSIEGCALLHYTYTHMEKKKKDTIGQILKYLNKHYRFSLDELTGQFFYQRRDLRTKKKLFDRAYFMRLLSGEKFKYDSSTIRESLKAIFYRRLNAVKAFLAPQQYLNPGGSPFDRIDDYFTLLGDPPFSIGAMLEMHLVRAIRCALQGEPNRFIFVLVSGQQYIGKTRFVEWLFPKQLEQYCMSTLSGRKEKIDTILASKFLVNIDEFNARKDTDNRHMKTMVSQHSAALWIPFKNTIEQRPRITSFFATANLGKKPILNTDDSNSRYIVFDLKSIDWDYATDIVPADLWHYAIAKAHDPSYQSELSIPEVRELEAYNRNFSQSTPKTLPKKSSKHSKYLKIGLGLVGLIAALLVSPFGRVAIASLVNFARSFLFL